MKTDVDSLSSSSSGGSQGSENCSVEKLTGKLRLGAVKKLKTKNFKQ